MSYDSLANLPTQNLSLETHLAHPRPPPYQPAPPSSINSDMQPRGHTDRLLVAFAKIV